jgi:signal recognition particle GTPase
MLDAMPIRRLLEGSGLGPEEVENLCRAYDDALQALHLVDRNDPIAEMVARKVIEIGKNGGDPAEIARRAVKAFYIG